MIQLAVEACSGLSHVNRNQNSAEIAPQILLSAERCTSWRALRIRDHNHDQPKKNTTHQGALVLTLNSAYY